MNVKQTSLMLGVAIFAVSVHEAGIKPIQGLPLHTDVDVTWVYPQPDPLGVVISTSGDAFVVGQ